MTVTYQVGGGGHLDIDFWLSDPINIALHKRLKESEGTASITAEKDGRYTYCFSNEMSTVTDKEVSFNVHGVIYVQDDDDSHVPSWRGRTLGYRLLGKSTLHASEKPLTVIQLSDPINIALHKRLKESEGTASLTAEKDGRYTYCFSNEMSTVTDKEVRYGSFNVHGVIYVQDDGTVAPIEREVRELAIGLQAVKDEQEYIVIRERMHRNTAESTNDRVKWWSIVQAVVLVAVCGFQVYYLQSFFEVKRVI
ncbi:unnamed protein product [Rhizoctonia solani]|uniref:GOLD domain-containing protein n=1 Tax=Rhizoctonia solani TaxID=456999 RepID=A0A8H3HLH8_9AGAM|nr:unnamed protein product [Rhizoctonia solani]